MSIVGEASSIAEAVDLANIQEPDVVLIDLMLDDENGIEATRKLAREGGRRVLALSDYTGPDQLEGFFAAGGAGFVSKTSPVKEISTAIRAALDNRRWISPSLSTPVNASGQTSKEGPMLSAREREVAVLIAKGLSSTQAASKLYVSRNTVETHRYRIFKKLAIHSRAELVDYVMRHGLITR